MYVSRLAIFILTAVIFSCSNQDGNAPTKFTEDEGSTLPPAASIYGSVKNSLTAMALANVNVTVYSGDTPVSATTTDSAGHYAFGEFTNGNYTISFAATGFVSINNSPVTVAGVALNINKSMTPPTLSGQLRIVLSWYAENPAVPNIARDLDTYLLNSTDNTFANYEFPAQTWTDGSGAALDADSTNYSGPETITLSNLSATSQYHFYVNNYSNTADCTSLGVSGVHVDVYSGSSLIKSYDLQPNSTGGAIYEFFTIENGQIVDKNQFNESLAVSGGAALQNCVP